MKIKCLLEKLIDGEWVTISIKEINIIYRNRFLVAVGDIGIGPEPLGLPEDASKTAMYFSSLVYGHFNYLNIIEFLTIVEANDLDINVPVIVDSETLDNHFEINVDSLVNLRVIFWEIS